jgi:hypothetical protein
MILPLIPQWRAVIAVVLEYYVFYIDAMFVIILLPPRSSDGS